MTVLFVEYDSRAILVTFKMKMHVEPIAPRPPVDPRRHEARGMRHEAWGTRHEAPSTQNNDYASSIG